MEIYKTHITRGRDRKMKGVGIEPTTGSDILSLGLRLVIKDKKECDISFNLMTKYDSAYCHIQIFTIKHQIIVGLAPRQIKSN